MAAAQSQYIYIDSETSTLRSDPFQDGIVRCNGCNYILSSDHAIACKFCLCDLNTRNKKLRSSLNEAKAEIFSLQKEMDFLRTWDERYINGTIASGDLVLRTRDGSSFFTYRFLMASRSPVFNKMLENKAVTELEIEDISAQVLGFFLDYLYRAQVESQTLEKHATGLLAAAHRYQIRTLKSACERYLTEHVHIGNVVSMMELAYKSNADDLKEAALHVVAAVYKDLLCCQEMKNLVEREPRIAAEMLKEILERTHL